MVCKKVTRINLLFTVLPALEVEPQLLPLREQTCGSRGLPNPRAQNSSLGPRVTHLDIYANSNSGWFFNEINIFWFCFCFN